MLPYYLPPYHFEHYPEGLKGRYVASPSTAALLGRRRIFSSRSEYAYRVSVDRKCRRRRRALEVALRATEREQQGLEAVLPSDYDDEDHDDEDHSFQRSDTTEDLVDAARYRWRVWSGIDSVEVRSRPTWSAVRPCIRTEEESAEAIARIAHWQSTSTLAADRELSYAGVVEGPEDDLDVWVKVEYDELDLFASPPPRSGTQPPASPGVQTLSRRPSFSAGAPLPGSQLLASPSNVRVRVESEEPLLSSLAPASPLPIKSESHSANDLVLLGQGRQSQAGTLFSPVSHATSSVHPRPVAQPRVKSEDDDEGIHLLLSSLCRVASPRAIPSLQPPVVTPLQWRSAPRQSPSPPTVVPFWARAGQDVIMREASEENLRARVVEPFHRRAGPAFSSFSAFAAAISPPVAQGAPATPLIRIESHSDEDLAGLRRWHNGEPSANAAPAPQSPQPPATLESLFGGDDLDDYEDEPTIRAVNLPAPQPPTAPASPLFGGDDSDEDEPTIIAVKPAPKPRGRKAREAAQVQVKREPTDADIDALLDEIFQENQFVHRSPPNELPQAHTQAVSQVTAPPVVHRPAGRPPSPPIQDVEMDTPQVQVHHSHTRLPHVPSVVRPSHIHDRTTARPLAGEARSPRIVDVKMEEDVQVVQVTQPLRWSKNASVPPVQAEPMETSVTFDGEEENEEQEDELWRELYAMRRDPDEWFRQPLPPASTPATVKSAPTASVTAALVNVRVESVPSVSLFDSSSVPAVVGPLVKTELVEAVLADLTFSSNGAADDDARAASDERSASEDADICGLIESFARLSIGSRLEALSPPPLESSDSLVSYLDAGDCADVPSPELAAHEVPSAMASSAAPLVKEELVEVSLSTQVLASNAPVMCQSPYKRIISSVECDEEVHLPHTGHQSIALLLRAAKETSDCPLDDEPGCKPPHFSLPIPGYASSPSKKRRDVVPPSAANQEKDKSELAASPSVFAAFLQRCTDAFHAQHPHEEETETSPSEEAAIEIYELYEALPAHTVRNVKVQSTANGLASSRSAHAHSREALKDTPSLRHAKLSPPSATALRLPPAVAVVPPSYSQCPPAPSHRPHSDDKSNTADAVQGSGASSSSSCPVSRDLKQRARESFLEYWNRGCMHELGTIPSVSEDKELGFEVDGGECPRPVVLSSDELDYYCEGAALATVPAPCTPSAGVKNDLVTGLALATLATATAPAANEDTHVDTVLACSTGPAVARVLAGTVRDDHDDSGSDTIKAGNSDGDEDDASWHCPASRSDKGKRRLLLDAPADDRLSDDLELFDAVYLRPEDYDLLSTVPKSKKPLLSPRSRHPPIRLRLPKPHRQVPSPASGSATSSPRPRASIPRVASHAASLIKRCLGLKPR